ncbi:MAG TPA: molybdopterin-binding protein [Casimicrobiaceae bacterium]|nr:molybdopterin-binding protein [Casimicrobiaceae bacterium]
MKHSAIGALIIGDEILTGKRQDKHFVHVIATLAARGLTLDYAHYLGDDRERLTAMLRETFARGDIVFSFGGIGATPDDHTRQAAAAALGVALELHPEAVREIEARFGAEAHPNRVRMAEFPAGSRIIPNPVNRVAGFAIRTHHFFPGFPQMAWPMLDWVLANDYPDLRREPEVERTLVVYDAGESQLVPLMEDNVARFPSVKLFSLPTFTTDGSRRLELGVRGRVADVEPAFAHLREGVQASGFRFEQLDGA